MNIFQTISVFDYIIAGCGVLFIILGIAQLCTKKVIGVGKIKQYTDESVRSFSVVGAVIYLIGGLLIAAAPFAVSFINLQNFGLSLPTALSRWILFVVFVVMLIAQAAILKKKL